MFLRKIASTEATPLTFVSNENTRHLPLGWRHRDFANGLAPHLTTSFDFASGFTCSD
jgi:hypothetical protein